MTTTQTPTPAQAAGPNRSATADAPSTILGLMRKLVSGTSPRMLILLFSSAAVARVWLAGWSGWDALVALGLVAFWPFQEWLIHVFLLHHRPRKLGPFTIDFHQAKKHRAHHLKPWDLTDIFVPGYTYLYATPILGLIAYLSWPNPVAFTGLTVYLALGLHYEWCHLMAHSNYTPRTRPYKAVWRNHRLHHFKNETQWMGVSTRVGDLVLGTCPDQRNVERSPTCRTLGILPPG